MIQIIKMPVQTQKRGPSGNSIEHIIDNDLLEVFAARIVRKHLLSQYVGSEHQVYINELRLIEEATDRLKIHIRKLLSVSDLEPEDFVEFMTQRVRRMCKSRIETHDSDAESKEAALEGVYLEDLSSLWPNHK